jgi:hypothetical protein
MEGKRISSQLEHLSYDEAEKERLEFEAVYQDQKEKLKEAKEER